MAASTRPSLPPQQQHLGVSRRPSPATTTTIIQSRAKRRHPRASSSSSDSSSAAVDVDVVVVGAGIIGLWTVYEALRRGASVALVDARRPCAGGASAQATGAGQGYLWLSHREPPSSSSSSSPSAASWHLVARGKRRWERLAGGIAAHSDIDRAGVAAELARCAELRRTGSLLLATTEEEAAALEPRAARLCAAPGGPAEAKVRVLATPRAVAEDEPAFGARVGGGIVRAALLVESDAQINGRGAALGLLGACRALGESGGGPGRFREALEDGAARISPRGAAADAAAQVETLSGRRFRARKGVVVAGGAWTGGLLAAALERAGGGGGGDAGAWRAFFAPRRGHLLEVNAAAARLPAPLRRGSMELSYSRHYQGVGAGQARAGAGHAGGGSSSEVTFTVTAGGGGGGQAAPSTLLFGSSRDAAGFDGRADARVVAAILARAAEFLPSMRPLADRAAAAKEGDLDGVRVGLRPWAAGGLPAIGPVPGLPGVVVAAGHEGSGLVMAPATAELALRWVGVRGKDEEEEEDDGGVWRRVESAVRAELAPDRRLRSVAGSL